MKHAGKKALSALTDLLEQIRKQPGVREKKYGVFYLKSSAFLHFHEDVTGLFADLRIGPDWKRFPVNSEFEKRAVIAAVIRTTNRLSGSRV